MLLAVKAVTRSLISMGAGATVLLSTAAPVDAAAVTEQAAKVTGISPTRDATVGVAHPVVVRFAGPVANRAAAQRSLRIATSPAMSGHFDWVDDDAVQWVPDRFWPGHSTVSVSVRGLSTEFRTGPVVVGVADTSAHTFTVTIDGVESGPPVLPAPHHRPYRGQPGVFPASMGSNDYPTPPGRYSVLAKDRSVLMDSTSVGIPITPESGYRFEVDHAVRISRRGLFVHAAPWALRSMGVENVSHGCIGLSPTDAEWYFDTVRVGDPVIVK